MIEGSVTVMRTQEGQQTVSNGGGNPSMPTAATKRDAELSGCYGEVVRCLTFAARSLLELLSPAMKYQRLVDEMRSVDFTRLSEGGVRDALRGAVAAEFPARWTEQGWIEEGRDAVTDGGRAAITLIFELLYEDMRFGLESWDSHSSSLMERVGANSWEETLTKLEDGSTGASATQRQLMTEMMDCLKIAQIVQSQIANPADAFPLPDMINAVVKFDGAVAGLEKAHEIALQAESQTGSSPPVASLTGPRQALGRLVDDCLREAKLTCLNSDFDEIIDVSPEHAQERFFEFFANATDLVERLTRAVNAMQGTFRRLEKSVEPLGCEKAQTSIGDHPMMAALISQFRTTERACLDVAAARLEAKLNDSAELKAAARTGEIRILWHSVEGIYTVERHLVDTHEAVSKLVDYMTACYEAMQLLSDTLMPLEAIRTQEHGQSGPNRKPSSAEPGNLVCSAFVQKVTTATPCAARSDVGQPRFFDLMMEILKDPVSSTEVLQTWGPIRSVHLRAAKELVTWLSRDSHANPTVGESWALVLVNQAITEAAQVINEGQNRIS